jgi:2-iminoacetate synthase ThiH
MRRRMTFLRNATLSLRPDLQASWVETGLDAAPEALRRGIDDLGGTLMEESISRLAGNRHGSRLHHDRLVRTGRPTTGCAALGATRTRRTGEAVPA